MGQGKVGIWIKQDWPWLKMHDKHVGVHYTIVLLHTFENFCNILFSP